MRSVEAVGKLLLKNSAFAALFLFALDRTCVGSDKVNSVAAAFLSLVAAIFSACAFFDASDCCRPRGRLSFAPVGRPPRPYSCDGVGATEGDREGVDREGSRAQATAGRLQSALKRS